MGESHYGTVIGLITTSLEAAFAKAGYSTDGISQSIGPSAKFGDISCSFALKAAKERRKNPTEVADEIIKLIGSEMVADGTKIGTLSQAGGYINLSLDRKPFSKAVVAQAKNLDQQSNVSDIGHNEKVIVEYPSVNPNKPWHLGHLKNAVLGDSVANMHWACGYNVEREDFIEDLGSQVVESVWGYLNLNKDSAGKKFDHWLGEEYVKVNNYMQVNKIGDQLSELLKKMEEKGTPEAALARKISENCVTAQNETAFSYGISRDVLIWETDIIGVELFKKALEELQAKGAVKKMMDGAFNDCYVIDLSEIKDLPPEFVGLKEKIKVLVRADGTPTYVGKDIAFHMWKFGMLGSPFRYKAFIEKQPNGKPLYTTTMDREGKTMNFGNVKKAINIIDSRQDYPQALLRLAFTLMGRRDITEGIVHLSYGDLELESGALSGRTGNWVGNTADDLFSETRKKTLSMLSESRFKMDQGETDMASSVIALGAIKFDLLRQAPEKKTIFSWTRALNFDSNSGPYCQYMYARAKRLLEDSGIAIDSLSISESYQVSDAEFRLVKHVAMLKDNIEKACRELRPNVITEYCNDLAAAFSSFYEQSPVLKAKSEEEKRARLALTFSFANALRYALQALGIPVAERM